MAFEYTLRSFDILDFAQDTQIRVDERDKELETYTLSIDTSFLNLNASNLTSGTVPSARVTGSYTGITGVGTLTVGSVPASLLTGSTLPSGITASSLTSVGTLSTLAIGGSITGYGGFLNFGTVPGDLSIYLGTNTAFGNVNIQFNSTTKLSVGTTGITVTGSVVATSFDGSGASLTSIPNSATTATSANTASTIVARNASGNFTAGTITATTFSGSGASLTSIPAGQLTGTVASARISGSYTGITSVGTLAQALTVSGGYVWISTSGQNYLCQSPTTGAGNAAHWVAVLGTYQLYRNTSTIREKENIQSVGTLLNPNMIDAINVQLWNRKTAPGIPEVGPMAEEMDAISPFLSTRGLDMNENGEYIPAPVDGINSNSWLSLLTIGMQDIRQRLQQLETT